MVRRARHRSRPSALFTMLFAFRDGLATAALGVSADLRAVDRRAPATPGGAAWAAILLRIALSPCALWRGEAEEIIRRGVCLEPPELYGYAGALCQLPSSSHSGQTKPVEGAVRRLVPQAVGQVPIDSGKLAVGGRRSVAAGLRR